MPPRIRRSRQALRFSTILAIIIVIVGISLAVASGGQGQTVVVGTVLALAGFLA